MLHVRRGVVELGWRDELHAVCAWYVVGLQRRRVQWHFMQLPCMHRGLVLAGWLGGMHNVRRKHVFA